MLCKSVCGLNALIEITQPVSYVTGNIFAKVRAITALIVSDIYCPWYTQGSSASCNKCTKTTISALLSKVYDKKFTVIKFYLE